jgi:phage gp36-like protein
MLFLTLDDFESQIRNDKLVILVDNDMSNLDPLEAAAMKEMENYLRQRFDVAQIWSKTGADRDPVLLLYMVDILLYHLYSRINPVKIPELRIHRYENAMRFLKAVAKGEITPNLPEPVDTADDIRWGSAPQLGHSY